jgi:hypothetical protein
MAAANSYGTMQNRRLSTCQCGRRDLSVAATLILMLGRSFSVWMEKKVSLSLKFLIRKGEKFT